MAASYHAGRWTDEKQRVLRLNQPPGHALVSSGMMSGNSFTFVVGIPHTDPQSDAFNGIWEQLTPTTVFNVSGFGTGTARNGTISGTFNGSLDYFTNAGTVNAQAIRCNATDHGFTLTQQ